MGQASWTRVGVGIALLSAVALVSARAAGEVSARSLGLVENGDRFFEAALFDPAQRSFREALAHDAQSGPAHLGLARTMAARGELDLAHGEAEVAVHLSPALPQAQLTLASVREQAGDTAGAAAALERYLAAEPPDPSRVRFQRARTHLALLRLASGAPLRTINGPRVSTISFDIVNDKVVLKASINGRVPADVVLDTGAEHLVLSDRTVQRAGLRRTGGGVDRGPEMTIADTFDVAGFTVRRVPAFIRREPLLVAPNRSGDAFSPLSLGLSLIIDYERRELTLAQRLPFEPADVELPLHLFGLPLVVGSSNGEALSFVVDTGSEVTSVSHAVLRRTQVESSARRIPMRLFDAWGALQADAFLLTPGLDLAFGAIRLGGFPVVVRSWPDVQAVHGFEMGGILGHNFLRRYRVSIDLARRVMRLKRVLPELPTK